MASKLYVQNFFEPTLSSATVAATGDVTFTLSVTPSYTKGFIVFSPSNQSQREIMYFDDVIGSTIYVKSENRWLGWTTAKAHTQGETVAMKDVAEIFNFFSNNISSAFYVEKKGGLNVTVWWGSVYYNGAYQDFNDTNFTLTAGVTNYIHYDYPTNTLTADTVDSGTTKATITMSGSVVSGITYRVAKESHMDAEIAITDALPSQVGKTGKFLQTDWTNVSWQDTLPSQTSNSGKFLTTNGTTASWAVVGITGEIKIWSTNSAPTGWLILDGAAISRTTYAALFAVISTTYWVGDGSTTFNLPDLRGRVAVGRDSGQTEFNTLGETWGSKTHTLTTNEIPPHHHTALIYGWWWAWSSLNTASGIVPTYSDVIWPNNIIGDTWGGAAHNNLQPYIALNYIIKT